MSIVVGQRGSAFLEDHPFDLKLRCYCNKQLSECPSRRFRAKKLVLWGEYQELDHRLFQRLVSSKPRKHLARMTAVDRLISSKLRKHLARMTDVDRLVSSKLRNQLARTPDVYRLAPCQNSRFVVTPVCGDSSPSELETCDETDVLRREKNFTCY
ncbi:hypothetical protein RRG08_060359 [Elysia crispata]|uniref:Uncharacterized protein n=1 Tax=Elysia crispata TaxID=231223 RepID=A0AAE0ZGA6_9GAST|nr:hypothetical protein RRG08_060359 [Elysia crispata]